MRNIIFKTNFDFDVVLYNKNKDEKFYLVNRKNVITNSETDNNFVKLLSELEEINYPLKVKTNTKRVFIDIEDFDNWLKEWKEKASDILENMEKGNMISSKEAIHVESAKEVNVNRGKKVKMQ